MPSGDLSFTESLLWLSNLLPLVLQPKPTPATREEPPDRHPRLLTFNFLCSPAKFTLTPIPPSKSTKFLQSASETFTISKPKSCNSQFTRERQRGFLHTELMAEKVALAGGSMSVDLVHKGYDGPPVTIPKLGLGVYQVPPRDALQATAHALQLGYRHIDSAALYRNEQAVGKAVRESGVPREQIFVTTKVWNSDQGYQNTLRAFERSLNELGLGYVDLYLVHSPIPSQRRLDTWKAMEEILRSGKAKAIGVSNYGVHHLKELFANCKIRPSVNQIQLHPFGTHEELVKFCEREGIVVEAYSPLTQGRRLKDRTLVQIAKEYKKSPAQILIRWCLQKNFVVLPKSVTPARILENSQVFDFNISEEHMVKLDGLDEGWYCGWDPTLDR